MNDHNTTFLIVTDDGTGHRVRGDLAEVIVWWSYGVAKPALLLNGIWFHREHVAWIRP